MKKQIQIALAEDHDIVIDGLLSLFEKHKEINVIVVAKNGEELLDKLKRTKVDIVLLDLDMPIMSGKEAFDFIKKEHPDLKIIIVSAEYRRSFVLEYLKKGANSFLPKNCGFSKLTEAILSVHERGRYYDSDVSDMLVKALSESKIETDTVDFTDKEINIIKLICEEKTTKEIAAILDMNSRTVEYHRSTILTKINSKSISAIVKYAIKHKIIQL